jgi:hypothetical protein
VTNSPGARAAKQKDGAANSPWRTLAKQNAQTAARITELGRRSGAAPAHPPHAR